MSLFLKLLFSLFFFNLAFSESANAVSLNYFTDRGFIEAGGFIFVCGLIMVFIPKVTKIGILLTLLGNVIVISRILFQSDILVYLQDLNAERFLEKLSNDDLRLYTGLIVICFIILLVALGILKDYLWRSFWRLFGFYKTNEEKIALEKTKQNEIEAKKKKAEANRFNKIMGKSAQTNETQYDQNLTLQSADQNNQYQNTKISIEDPFSYDKDIELDMNKAKTAVLGKISNKN